MKPIIASIAFLFSAIGTEAYDGKYLNIVILKLPASYLADVPIEDRARLLENLSGYPFEDERLDYGNGWIHFFSDGGDHEDRKGRPTSMFYVKLLPRKNQSPLVFVHMAKPFADGQPPGTNQTFVLERSGDEWKDVSKSVIPKDVDMTAHFLPRRKVNEIEVAPYEKIPRQDGRGFAYQFGERKLDLVWNGSAFDVRKAASPKLSDDD